MSTLDLTIGREHLAAERRQGKDVVWSAETAVASHADLEGALAGLPALEGWQGVSRAIVLLTDELVQRRVLRDVPPVSDAALRDIVALQQARFFRRQHPLTTNARWLARNRRTGAEAVAAEAACLDAIARGLEAAGLRSVTIRALTTHLELTAPSHQASGQRRRRALNNRLIGLAVMCWVGAPSVHMARLVAADRRLSNELRTLAAPAEALRSAHREFAAGALIVDRVEAGQRERQKLAALVGELVTALPESAFVSTLSLPVDGDGVLTGAAQQPALFIDGLEKIESIATPRLEGASTPESGAGRWETFAIRFQRRRP